MAFALQPRPLQPRKMAVVLIVLVFATYFYYQREPTYRYWRLSGATMGTTYTVKLLDRYMDQASAKSLRDDIDELLVDINRQMSTYITNSEITLFNQSSGASPFPVSEDFSRVAGRSLELCEQTGGAFDPALDPLINAWGFGHEGPRKNPSPQELEEAQSLSGCGMLTVESDGALRKTHPGAKINVNAIAKGYGVDAVSRLINDAGITNFMVEIGGEVFARGISEKIRPWRIGIDKPEDGSLPGEAVQTVVQIDGVGLASSGNYRNYVINENGEKVVHLLDPRSGRPVTSNLGSVTVIAQDCMTADALATALFVMGTDEGLAWVNANPGIEAAFIWRGPDDDWQTSYSDGFEAYIFE